MYACLSHKKKIGQFLIIILPFEINLGVFETKLDHQTTKFISFELEFRFRDPWIPKPTIDPSLVVFVVIVFLLLCCF